MSCCHKLNLHILLSHLQVLDKMDSRKEEDSLFLRGHFCWLGLRHSNFPMSMQIRTLIIDQTSVDTDMSKDLLWLSSLDLLPCSEGVLQLQYDHVDKPQAKGFFVSEVQL